MASLRAEVAWGFRARVSRAARLLFVFGSILLPTIFGASSEAHAQWICSVSPDIFCQNSTDQSGAGIFTQSAVGTENVSIINLAPGIADGISANTNEGNALADNRGTILGLVEAVSNNGGNATALNSGLTFGLSATANNGGNATATNSGTVFTVITSNAVNGNSTVTNTASGLAGALITQAQGGTATTNNFGNVLVSVQTNTFFGDAVTFNSGTVQNLAGPGPGIDTRTDGSGNATTINTGTVSGGISTITGETFGGGHATTINSGTVFGDVYVGAADGGAGTGNATLINYGSIIPDNNGVQVSTLSGNAVFANFGTIDLSNSFPVAFIYSQDGNATGYNAGSIIGEVNVVASFGGTATFTNAGFIDGRITGVAIDMSQFVPNAASVLNFMPGSRIIGEVGLSGYQGAGYPGTTVNFFAGGMSTIVTFGLTCGCLSQGGLTDTGSTVNVFGGAPYVVNGNTVAVLDPSSFSLQDRNLVDVTRTISSMVSGRLMNPAPVGGGSTAIGFAPTGNVATDMARDAFAGISSLGYAAQDRVLIGNPNYTAADGTSIWAQGFGGRRVQSADTPILRSVNNFYGGAMGVDKAVRPGLRLGGFIGAGSVKSTLDLNAGDTSSDMVFGGGYGRYAMKEAFVDFALLGGHSSNDVKRTIANNLAPNGLESAVASYNGWFISPEIAYGFQKTIAPKWTMTPTARVRYLAANFAGYQEAGSTTNLTVASRTTHNFEERGEVTFAYTTQATPKERMQLSGTVGALALQRAGDSTVNTVLLGQSLAFATPGKNNVFGIYTGAGFDWRHSTGVSVFGATEFTAMSDSSRTLTGRGGVRYAF